MKARVKATGEIVEIAEYSTIYLENYDSCFYPSDLEFLDIKEDTDYWTRLEHQYAGMAMQGMLSRQYVDFDKIIEKSIEIAHALVEKYKKEERK